MTARRKITYAVLAVVFVTVAVVYFVFDPSSTRLFPKCAFLSLTGFKCPGCGSQRAIHALLHADVIGAIRYNALLVITLPFIAFVFASRYWKAHFPRLYSHMNSTTVSLTAAVIVCLWWILRNIYNW